MKLGHDIFQFILKFKVGLDLDLRLFNIALVGLADRILGFLNVTLGMLNLEVHSKFLQFTKELENSYS